MQLSERLRKLYKTYAKTAVIALLFLLVAIPFSKKVVNGGTTFTTDTRYLVLLNGEEVGYVSDESVASAALLQARTELSTEYDGLALVESDLETQKNTSGGAVLSEDELSDAIYTNLSSNVLNDDSATDAYTVRINDFTVTLASKEDVSELLESVKDKYSDSNEFTVELVSDDTSSYSTYKTNFVSADKTVNEAAKVLATMDGTSSDEEVTEDTVLKNGVLSVGFVQNIEVIKTKASNATVLSVEDAYNEITKEKEAKGTHTVAAGECLTGIAKDYGLTLKELFALNSGFDEDTVIYEGDVLTVTVPTSEISVEVIEEKSYDEKYNAEVQYVDNASLYVGTENVIQAGSAGYRSVVALVTYVNGVESDREIISQEVTKKAVAKIVERGTLTPPTYIKPVNSTNITSPFGYRIHPITGAYTLHTGVDWYVPTGTAVKASASGTVVAAGWNGGYGYCLDIQHSDGSLTRYAHLSSFAASVGQTVTQGQIVAYSGNTGDSTGPHLHFEIRINGNPVNPIDYTGN